MGGPRRVEGGIPAWAALCRLLVKENSGSRTPRERVRKAETKRKERRKEVNIRARVKRVFARDMVVVEDGGVVVDGGAWDEMGGG